MEKLISRDTTFLLKPKPCWKHPHLEPIVEETTTADADARMFMIQCPVDKNRPDKMTKEQLAEICWSCVHHWGYSATVELWNEKCGV